MSHTHWITFVARRGLLFALPLLAALAGACSAEDTQTLSSAALNAPRDIAMRDASTEVREIFATKCAACHGADLQKPKGRFGYVLDLKRVAANSEMIVPSRPDESELLALVENDEMPPPDSPRGPLSAEQKRKIRAWIAAGAPWVAAAAQAPPEESKPKNNAVEGTSPGSLPAGSQSVALLYRLAAWLGKFHLVLLHFPIALVLAAGFAEALSFWRRTDRPDVVRFCLILAACTAIPTAALGWMFAATGNGLGSPQLLAAHRWVGTAAAIWIVATAIVLEIDRRRGDQTWRKRSMMFVAMIVVPIAGHLGGLLARGASFFNF